MTTVEIQEAAIASADKLLAWMKENDKGRDEIPVLSIRRKGNAKTFSLKVARQLFNADAVLFKLSSVERELSAEEVKIKHYDKDKGRLIVRPNDDCLDYFERSDPNDIKVISDLRWLVERTKGWYVENGASMAMPSRTSLLSAEAIKPDELVDGREPNEEQQAAVTSIFNDPFSYVWGAPGTGKTQFVLAYSALRYARADKQIAIVAPTNLSLEQVLRGIAEKTRAAGIADEKILRLGNPTRAFAEDFPEMCEVQGLQNKLDDIDRQLGILEELFQVKEATGQLRELYDKVVAYPTEVQRLTELMVRENAAVVVAKKSVTENERSLRDVDIQLRNKRKEGKSLLRQQDGIWAKLSGVFSGKKAKLQQQITQNTLRIAELEGEQILLKKQGRVLSEQVKATSQKSATINADTNRLSASILRDVTEYDWLSEFFTDEAAEALESHHAKITGAISGRLDELEASAAVAVAYRDYNPTQITELKTQYEQKRAALEEHSTAMRLEHVNIVAMTLDSYIIRYTETKLGVEHIFLDEAGYASQIKAMTLFNHDVPITFLGDHMQLPPVCEVDNTTIETTEGYESMSLWAESALHSGTLFGEATMDEARHAYLTNRALENPYMTMTALTRTHRFGEKLAEVLSNFVYGGQFTSAVGQGQTRITVIDAKRLPDEYGRRSTAEVNAIERLVRRYRAEGRDYVILAPYKNQIANLNGRLPESQQEERILTVHKSQGREWDTVILSVTDKYPDCFTDTKSVHMKGLNVINTAVSRAKQQLVIVCNYANFSNWPGQLLHGLVSVGELQTTTPDVPTTTTFLHVGH